MRGTKGKSPRYPLVSSGAQMEIMRYVRAQDGPVSRARLTGSLGVSRSKIAGEVGQLLESGLLVEDGYGESEGGRRSTLLRVSRDVGYVVGVDLGATSIDVALTTLGSIPVSHRGEPADIKRGPKQVLGRVKEMLAGLLEEQGAGAEDVLAIGIGVPGPVEHVSGLPISPPIMPGWDRFPVRDFFADEYGAPVFVDNDVNVIALGEHWGGVGQGVDDMVCVKIGTGIGCGIIAGGRLYRGSQGSAGDIGHICVDPSGPACSCGNVGCLETMAAVPGMVREARKAAEREPDSVLGGLRGRGELDVRGLLGAVAHGDHESVMIIRRSGRLIGQVLATLVSVLNPSLIVIGGGVALAAGQTLLAEIRSVVYQRSLPLATRNLPIVLGELGGTAGVIGASVLAAEGVLVTDP